MSSRFEHLASLKIVVAGGAGFVGSHLAKRLIAEGAGDLTVIDNLATSITGSRDLPTGVKFIHHHVAEPINLDCDLIFNLACRASPVHYQADPLDTWRTSVLGCYNLGHLAEKNKARLVQASTSEVYGDPLVHPQTEAYLGNVSCTGPRACYDEGKRAAETYLLDLSRHAGVDVRIARIFNTYGPNMAFNDGRVVSNFVKQAIDGDALTVHGDGKQTRSFCYVDDLVDGLMRLAFTPDISGEIINLGNPDERSILDIASLVNKISGAQNPVSFEERPVDDPNVRCPDITKARSILGWEPKTPLEAGLKATYENFQARSQIRAAS